MSKRAISLIIGTSTKSSSAEPIHQSNPIHTLLFKFYDEVKVLYDQASVSKSSITVDTAFQKDLTL
jgi:hypothetical protein